MSTASFMICALLSRRYFSIIIENTGSITNTIIAAFIIIPQLREFASTVMGELDTWWSSEITGTIFPDS